MALLPISASWAAQDCWPVLSCLQDLGPVLSCLQDRRPVLSCLQGLLETPPPEAARDHGGRPQLPGCVLHTLPNSVHFPSDGKLPFWVFLSRDADLMDCDFSPDPLFKKKKGSIKKATQFLFAQGKKNLLAIQALDFPGRLVYLPAKMLAKGKHICYRSEIFILFWAGDPKNFI